MGTQPASKVFERPSPKRILGQITLILAIVALILSLFAAFRPKLTGTSSKSESAFARTKRTKVFRAGYSGFRPYTIIDLNAPTDRRISGFCADMINEIASRQNPPWSVEWHKVTFETLKGDMESGQFDVFADAVYQTIPRASEFGLTLPYSYFGVAVGLVRKTENRFTKFEDLDRPDITISLAEGWTSTEYARAHLKLPKFHVVAVADDPFIQFQDVLAGKADIALQDVPTVLQFVRAHPDQVKALWIDNPPTRVPAGFMTQPDELEFLRFLDSSIRILQADGTLARLDQKWGALSEFPKPTLVQGAGMSNH